VLLGNGATAGYNSFSSVPDSRRPDIGYPDFAAEAGRIKQEHDS